MVGFHIRVVAYLTEMCGIAGIVGLPGRGSLVVRMLDVQSHRGPDGSGIWSTAISDESEMVIGHRRLSILDLSDAAAQPMVDRSGRYVLTYNGEIYNYLEIRSELSRLGSAIFARTFRYRSCTRGVQALGC